ncbi:MAG TPA: glycosyltransferase family 2 protein [Solirubrobacteraceae bacterium]|jgi:hypothetical protein|nr:glycosyltransferase family 2 protein [Solirubrobacteraceae bacterium]
MEKRGYAAIVRLSVRHVHGPRRIDYGRDEVLAISVVRNGELHVRSFLDHHFALGVKHIVLLLNDSTDATAAIAATYPNVTLVRCDLPYSRYENLMKRYLAQRFSAGRWNLCVDIDELFDYPNSDQVALRAVLTYLNEHRYTAVVAQMLDMFADGPLERVRSHPEDRLRDAYPFYDISAIRKADYYFSRITNPDVMLHFGGIRSQVFRTGNGLTKAALVKVEPEIELFVTWHHVNGATLADFTCVILHYPFVETFVAKVADAVSTGRYGYFVSDEYQRYWEGISQGESLILRKDSARELEALTELLDSGFLVHGPQFAEWYAARLAAAAPA